MAQYGGGPGTGSRMRCYMETSGATDPSDIGAVWTPTCEIVDLNIDDTRNTAEMRRRCNDFAKGLPAKRNVITADFRMVFGLDKAFRDLLVAAYEAGTVMMWQFLSDDISEAGAHGLMMPAFVSAFPWDQPLEDVSGHDIVLTGGFMEDDTIGEIDPEWVVTPY